MLILQFSNFQIFLQEKESEKKNVKLCLHSSQTVPIFFHFDEILQTYRCLNRKNIILVFADFNVFYLE